MISDLLGPIFCLLCLCSFFFFNWCIVDLQCYVNFCCTAKWFSYTYTYFFKYFFPLWFITGYWIYFRVLYSRTLLFIHCIYTSLHLLTQNSHAIPPHPSCRQPQVSSLCLACVLDWSFRSGNHSPMANGNLFYLTARYLLSRIPFHHQHLLGALRHPLPPQSLKPLLTTQLSLNVTTTHNSWSLKIETFLWYLHFKMRVKARRQKQKK